jgi:two-component system, NtrC family, sensor kinase
MIKIVRFSFITGLFLIFSCLYVLGSLTSDSAIYSGFENQTVDKVGTYKALCMQAKSATDADSIIKFSDQAIDFATRSELNPASAYLLKGNGFQLSGKNTLAMEFFTHAAELFQNAKDPIGLATAYTYISEAYISQQNHDNAKLYLGKAIQLFHQENDSGRLASALHNLGFEYYKTEQYDSALLLFAHAISVYQNLNYEMGIAYCIGNSGLVYSKLNKLSQAEKNLMNAINLLNKYDDPRAIADFTNEYAFVLQRKGNIQEAIRNAQKSYKIADLNNITELKRDAAYRLSHIYEQIHRYDSAFRYLLIYYSYSDSIRNLESIQKTADLRTEFEVAQKQTEVDILEKNKTLQRIIIASLILILALATGLIGIIYTNLKRNRRLAMVIEERRKQLEIKGKELKDLNQIKDRFFSIISHDLRTPIASMSGISYLIKESLEQDNKALLLQTTDYIDQSVVSLTGLLENLLNWALSQQGKFPFKEEAVELESIINEALKAFFPVSLAKDQKIHIDCEKGLFILADRNSMMAIVRNLLSNAIKFTQKRGEITIATCRTENGMVKLLIKDNGIGIPANKMDSLFQLKDDKSSRGTENEKGIGLGLTLVNEFITLNNGSIKVESKEGEGTTFRIEFPMKS